MRVRRKEQSKTMNKKRKKRAPIENKLMKKKEKQKKKYQEVEKYKVRTGKKNIRLKKISRSKSQCFSVARFGAYWKPRVKAVR